MHEVPWNRTKDRLHFLVICTDRIGDTFNTIYFLANLRRSCATARLTYIGRVFGDPSFLKGIIGQYVDQVLLVEHPTETQFVGLAPDAVFDLNQMAHLFKYYPSDVAVRIGHHDRCDIRVAQGKDNAKANDHLNLLRALGFAVDYTYQPIALCAREDRRILPRWCERPYIALSFEATDRTRVLPQPLMDSFMEFLLAAGDWDLFILGSNINGGGYVYCGSSPRVHQCTGVLSLYQAMHVIRGADYVISIDTGLMHAASYLGTPLLAIFTWRSNPHKNGPQGQCGRVVLVDVEKYPPSTPTNKERLQTWPEQDFLRVDHLVDGFETLLRVKSTTFEDRLMSVSGRRCT